MKLPVCFETEELALRQRGEVAPLADGIDMWWLGQAGFLVRIGCRTIVIDPYLSDSLAKKYAGSEFPHVRMMPAPILASELQEVDLVLCSHHHTDHMDPETLKELVRVAPHASIVVPRASKAKARERGVPDQRISSIDAGETIYPIENVTVHAIPAAHETIEQNSAGEHFYLGYVLRLGAITLYHSGDTVPYEGLRKTLAPFEVDVALLPVNGRDEHRRCRGVPGNLTVDEAVQLGLGLHMSVVIGHHYGMFEFNTVDAIWATERIQDLVSEGEIPAFVREYTIASADLMYRISRK